MRDYSSNYTDLDYNPYAESTTQGLGSLKTIALIGAVALIATPVITTLVRRWRSQQNVGTQSEPEIDKTLKDTYPASDPPASRYFDIPENRL